MVEGQTDEMLQQMFGYPLKTAWPNHEWAKLKTFHQYVSGIHIVYELSAVLYLV